MADEKEKLNNSLQCHVCFEDYKVNDRIWQCKSGHSICSRCRDHLKKCPFCKAPYQGTRNYAIEDIVRELNESSDDEGNDSNLSITPGALGNEPSASDSEQTAAGSQPSAPIINYDDVDYSSQSTAPQNGSNDDNVNLLDEFRDLAVPGYIVNYGNVSVPNVDYSSQSTAQQSGSNGNNVNLLDEFRDLVVPGDENSDSSDEFRDVVIVDAPAVQREGQNYESAWIDCYPHDIPSNIIRGGRDQGDQPLYIGRAEHANDLLPGKVNLEYERCFVAWGGAEHEKRRFQVLSNDVSGTWLPNSGGTIPQEAFPGGYTVDGETLYIGRAYVDGTLAIGKVHPSHGCCYVSYQGLEYSNEDYEIFVLCPDY